LQAAWRGKLARREAQRRRHQNMAREAEEWNQHRLQQAAAITLQAAWRGKLGFKEAQRRWQEDVAKQRQEMVQQAAAITLQAAWRGKLGRQEGHRRQQEALLQYRNEVEEWNNFHRQQAAAITLQAAWRGKLARREAEKRRRDHYLEQAAAVTLQAAWRGKLARKEAQFRRQEIADQSPLGQDDDWDWQAWNQHLTEQAAAITLQSAWRGARARKEAQRRRQEAMDEQMESQLELEGWRQNAAATTLQAAWRGALAKREAEARRQHNALRAYRQTMLLSVSKLYGKARKIDQEIVVVEVPPGVKEMGWNPSGMPPDLMLIAEIEPESWADEANLQLHDELVKIDDNPVSLMTEKYVIERMRGRPLKLQFRRKKRAHRSSIPLRGGEVINIQQLKIHAVSGKLGLIFDNHPPHPVTVSKSYDWSAEKGVKVGDELVEINGVPVASMTDKEFIKNAQCRPITLLFNCAGASDDTGSKDDARTIDDRHFIATASRSESQLGFGITASRKLVKTVQFGSWAYRARIHVGDVLIAVNGHDVEKVSKKDLIAMLQSKSDRTLKFRYATELEVEKALIGGHTSRQAVKVEATNDEILGFTPSSYPPEQVFIETVQSGTWSERVGLKVNDKLVLVNGEDLHGMTVNDLKPKMQARPLNLTFVRGEKPTKETDDEASDYEDLSSDTAEEERQDKSEPQGGSPDTARPNDPDRGASGSQAGGTLGKDPSTGHPAETKEEKSGIQAGDMFEISFGHEIHDLGFTCTAPPNSVVTKLSASRLMTDTELQKGDVLLEVDGDYVTVMDGKELDEALLKRPLVLLFQRPDAPAKVEAKKERKEESKSDISNQFEKTLYDHAKNHGFKPVLYPPNPVFIKRVELDSFAHDAGIKEGDEILEMNGIPMSAMTKESFKKTCKDRPLLLLLRREKHKKKVKPQRAT